VLVLGRRHQHWGVTDEEVVGCRATEAVVA
jgi:hypothetical protein